MQDLKDYRDKELKSYVFANLVVLLYLEGCFNWLWSLDAKSVEILKLFIPFLAGLSVIYVYIFISDSLLPSDYKTKIVFWRSLQPGYKVFSNMAKGDLDGRFGLEQLLNKYATIYENMPVDKEQKSKYENQHWYKIYGKHRGNSMIEGSSKDYLLCRDLTSITVILSFFYLLLYCALLGHCVNCKFLILLIAEYLILIFASRKKAKRFVYNVIAVDINHKDKKPEPKEFRVYLRNER